MPDDFVTVVSGLPRSGTSLLMQMLQAGGMPLLTDGRRAPDEHNPRGYFEDERVKYSRTDLSWLEEARGRALKVVHLLLFHLPTDMNFRVIFMLRDLEEVIASQRVMLHKQGRTAASLDDVKLAGIFARQIALARQWLSERPNFCVLYVKHSDLIDNPAVTAGQINIFLGGNLLAAKMAEAVNPALHRQRKSVAVQRTAN